MRLPLPLGEGRGEGEVSSTSPFSFSLTQRFSAGKTNLEFDQPALAGNDKTPLRR